ncbi:aconitase/3-isopropylmalate dehydratase large subunit family protein [Phenylobacterium immobile]|uniref:aconitase/3-isopropylmalate dehydratase large subunit family protein n=1 Tax=Phenylobacterium immobile TaxID=21 RepID=UPI000A45B71F|nr:aconitase/3-isopropylmalate dehydratase large subunit family protein [Phenylobacterium immobile]
MASERPINAGATLAQKVIARAAGLAHVLPGDLATVSVDLAFAHDSSGPRRWAPALAELGAKPWDVDKIAIVSDHYVPAVDAESAAILQLTRNFAAEQGITRFFDMVGICHLVLPEHGLIRPGAFVAGGDSHTPTAGAFGAVAMGFGATDMLAVVVTGKTWVVVPETVQVNISGAFADGVAAKDVMLALCRLLGLENGGKVVEFCGETVRAMPMGERMVLCNMAAELGFDTGVIAPDQTTFDYLAARGAPVADAAAALSLATDADAVVAAVHHLDASALQPQIAAPHSPGNSGDVADYSGVKVDQAYIGACVGAKIEDLRMAAEVLRGRRVAPGVRLLIAPASQATLTQATKEGVMTHLLEAGATMMASGCGACAGMGAGILAPGETCISSTNRNFKGRMGADEAFVYLGSPYSVAAAAVAGHIVDPRSMLAERIAA